MLGPHYLLKLLRHCWRKRDAECNRDAGHSGIYCVHGGELFNKGCKISCSANNPARTEFLVASLLVFMLRNNGVLLSVTGGP